MEETQQKIKSPINWVAKWGRITKGTAAQLVAVSSFTLIGGSM